MVLGFTENRSLIAPFRHPFMNDALERIQGLKVNMICTGHGPVHGSHIDDILALYREWCAVPAPREKKLVVIPYVNAYGYTGELAQRIGVGIADACGDEAEIYYYDMVTADAVAVSAELGACDAFLPVHGGKLASAFGSYG